MYAIYLSNGNWNERRLAALSAGDDALMDVLDMLAQSHAGQTLTHCHVIEAWSCTFNLPREATRDNVTFALFPRLERVFGADGTPNGGYTFMLSDRLAELNRD